MLKKAIPIIMAMILTLSLAACVDEQKAEESSTESSLSLETSNEMIIPKDSENSDASDESSVSNDTEVSEKESSNKDSSRSESSEKESSAEQQESKTET